MVASWFNLGWSSDVHCLDVMRGRLACAREAKKTYPWFLLCPPIKLNKAMGRLLKIDK